MHPHKLAVHPFFVFSITYFCFLFLSRPSHYIAILFEYLLFVCINYVQTLICFSLVPGRQLVLNDTEPTSIRPSFYRYFENVRSTKRVCTLGKSRRMYRFVDKRADLIARYFRPKLDEK